MGDVEPAEGDVVEVAAVVVVAFCGVGLVLVLELVREEKGI